MNIVTESFTPKQITSTTNVQPGSAGSIGGIFCSSGAATVTIYDAPDNTPNSQKIVDTFTPTPGTFTPLPFEFKSGCLVVMAGTGSITVGIRQQ